jgi:FkbM family methyltransferase
VGAHIGIFTLKVARLVGKEGIVLAIGPNRENYSFLISSKNINNLENVIPVCTALSDYCGKVRLYSWKNMNAG